ncbi:amidohydrolase family protein [Falsiroseomonas stagni]|uniref:5-methylthioadenosine/S-adenosylhomocysteine deaminase n=1 Tax=Falsiroseomonas stagni DSM 19981 TaxID=1123062 RepID=A0A1I4EXL3_9PROT|nr:amidohydrolase family protein [Falsiroseomonas stagni]SFL10414.1 5-methylthioadenosine/S-adenosylhomocysteine deaminase [Falsiroseomonas stagni DSM 19981]
MPIAPALLIRGARAFTPGCDPHRPAVRDVLVVGDRIAAISDPDGPPLVPPPGAEIIDARDRLLMPGLVSAHYHSYDALLKGRFEDMPFDVWALHSQPAYWGRRSKAEIRARTLLGAMECLRNGITTIQDMNSLVPQDEETLDTILSAYAEIGIRVVFSIALRDLPDLDIAPFMAPDLSVEAAAIIGGKPGDPAADLAFVEAQLKRLRPLPARLHWALSPSGPQRSSTALLEGIADLSERYGLPVFTHVYETRAQLAKARRIYGADGGSMVRHMARIGLLTPRTTLAHAVHITEEEIALVAESGAGVVHNPLANLKLKNGVAPVAAMKRAGVRVALGCDNNSCSDCQNLFQAMKMMSLLAAGSDAEPAGVLACDAVEAATTGGARAVGLDAEIGTIAPGMKADLLLLDLRDPAWLPFTSATRQLVFSETGRGVDTVLVDGRVVVRHGRLTLLDEATYRGELAEVMEQVEADFARLLPRQAPAIAPLLDANARLAAQDLGLDRLAGGGLRGRR